MNKQIKLPLMAAAAAFIVTIFIILQLGKAEMVWLDDQIMHIFSDMPAPIISFFISITHLGSKKFIGIFALAVVLWLWIKKRDFAGMAALVFAVAFGNEGAKILKDLFARPRPSLEHLVDVSSYSFPSGHAMVGMILYGFTAFLLSKHVSNSGLRAGIFVLATLIIFLMGLSRIVLHVHYPSDVIGGYAIGYMWVYLWMMLYEKYGGKLNRKK